MGNESKIRVGNVLWQQLLTLATNDQNKYLRFNMTLWVQNIVTCYETTKSVDVHLDSQKDQFIIHCSQED